MAKQSGIIYSIKSGAKANSLDVKNVADVDNLHQGYTSFFPFCRDNNTYLLAFDKTSLEADIYSVQNESNLSLECSSQMKESWDILTPFLLAGQNLFIAYQASSGLYSFFRIEGDLSLKYLYKYQKTYGDVTTGFTTIAPFSYRYGVYYVSYNKENGNVNYSRLTVPANNSLYSSKIWSDKWAKGWTRFAFFKMGGENFFLKTNTVYRNVNIDHIMSDPTQGSHPVGTHLDLTQDLNIVMPFALPGGNPYFVAYRNNGKTKFNRINGNCLGWVQEAAITVKENCNSMVPFTLGDKNYLLVY